MDHKLIMPSICCTPPRDYAIVSTKRRVGTDSGTLSDAVAYGLPVCCSDMCEPGTQVAAHGLGLTFANGDPDSLRDAVGRLIDFEVDTEGRAALIHARSDTEVARRYLAVTVRPDYQPET